jgi:hypothetical protein
LQLATFIFTLVPGLVAVPALGAVGFGAAGPAAGTFRSSIAHNRQGYDDETSLEGRLIIFLQWIRWHGCGFPISLRDTLALSNRTERREGRLGRRSCQWRRIGWSSHDGSLWELVRTWIRHRWDERPRRE